MSNSPSLSRSAEPGPWRFSASVGVKEAIDDNVLLQNVTSNAWRQSLVTTVNPKAGIRYEAAPNFIADLSYGPEVNIFHSESTEDFVFIDLLSVSRGRQKVPSGKSERTSCGSMAARLGRVSLAGRSPGGRWAADP